MFSRQQPVTDTVLAWERCRPYGPAHPGALTGTWLSLSVSSRDPEPAAPAQLIAPIRQEELSDQQCFVAQFLSLETDAATDRCYIHQSNYD